MYRVYKITNTVNNKIYIGYTKLSLMKRMRLHVNSKTEKMLIVKAINKYGAEKFTIELVQEFSSKQDAVVAEISLIESLKPHYNIHQGGTGGPMYGPMNGMFGKKHSTEWKINKSESMTGSQNPMFGKTHSLSARDKISAARKGRPTRKGIPLSEEHKNKLRSPKSEITKQKMRNKYIVDGFIVTDAKKYCMDNNLNYICFTQAAKKQKPYKGKVVILKD